jgi:hypothetical protein
MLKWRTAMQPALISLIDQQQCHESPSALDAARGAWGTECNNTNANRNWL